MTDAVGEMVERVALRLYVLEARRTSIPMNPPEEFWPHDREHMRERYRAQARAAIIVMRGPTDEMAKAGGDTCLFYEAASGTNQPESAVAVWQAMIDEALK